MPHHPWSKHDKTHGLGKTLLPHPPGHETLTTSIKWALVLARWTSCELHMFHVYLKTHCFHGSHFGLVQLDFYFFRPLIAVCGIMARLVAKKEHREDACYDEIALSTQHMYSIVRLIANTTTWSLWDELK